MIGQSAFSKVSFGCIYMSQTVLRGENIHSGYGKLQVINGVDIHINEGELVTIIGPNGSGKSTLIRTLIGLVSLFKGHVYIRDREVSGMRPHEIIGADIPLGYVPQLSNVFPSLTIEENLTADLRTITVRDDGRGMSEESSCWESEST